MKITPEQLKDIKEVLKTKGFGYRHSNGIHNFANAAIKEGITLKPSGDMDYFWIDTDETRKYGFDTVGNDTRDAGDIIRQILMGTETDMMESAKVHEAEMDAAVIVEAVDQLTTGIVPQYLTDELIAKHPGTVPALISMQRTNPEMIKERKGQGGKMVKYVDTAYMNVALNWATLMDWSFEILETREDIIDENRHYSVLGCVTVHSTEGKTILKQQWGSQVLKNKMEVGDALKAAASDSMKKCASMLGIAADVYGGSA